MSSEISLLASLVRKCTSTASLKQARQLHARLLTAMDADSHLSKPYIYNNVLSMYAKCGSFGDALKVFDEMPLRNVVSYNALISAYSRFPGDAFTVLRLSAQMGFDCLRPNQSTFISLLQVSSVLRDLFTGSLFHCQVVKFGFESDQRVQTSLLGMYSNYGDITAARRVFQWLVDKDVVAWNSILSGNLKNGDMNQGVEIFYEMLRAEVCPNQSTYSMMFKLCGKLGNSRLGKFIHARVVVSNFRPDVTMLNSLLDMYCNCGDTGTALTLFLEMESWNLVTWNSMILGCVENGYRDMALLLYIKFKGIDVKADEYTFSAAVSATSSFEGSIYGKYLHGQVIKAGFEENVFVGAALVSMYFKNNEARDAERVFYSVPKKDPVIWTEMMTGLSRSEDSFNSIRYFCEMCREGYEVDSFALSGALGVCADLTLLRYGEMVQSRAVKTGYDAEMSICGSLVDMYAKNGVIWDACKVFSQAVSPDLKCWNAMLAGYSHHGMAREAFETFDEILKHGLKPDQRTFLSVLSACNHRGLVEKGKQFWDSMIENGINPGPKHYCCMVSLLCRAGLMDEAEEMIVKSPFGHENIELWRTLLSSCVFKKNLTTGIRAAEEALKLDAKDSATHVLLSNLYAASGKWDRVSDTRRNIKGLMLEKDPGLSWFESKNSVIQVFSSGIQLDPEVLDAEIALQMLLGNMMRSEQDDFESLTC